MADVAAWLEGGNAMKRIRAFLSEHISVIRGGIPALPVKEMVEAAKLLDRGVERLTDDEIERFVELIDAAQVFGNIERRPKRFTQEKKFIGY